MVPNYRVACLELACPFAGFQKNNEACLTCVKKEIFLSAIEREGIVIDKKSGETVEPRGGVYA